MKYGIKRHDRRQNPTWLLDIKMLRVSLRRGDLSFLYLSQSFRSACIPNSGESQTSLLGGHVEGVQRKMNFAEADDWAHQNARRSTALLMSFTNTSTDRYKPPHALIFFWTSTTELPVTSFSFYRTFNMSCSVWVYIYIWTMFNTYPWCFDTFSSLCFIVWICHQPNRQMPISCQVPFVQAF